MMGFRSLKRIRNGKCEVLLGMSDVMCLQLQFYVCKANESRAFVIVFGYCSFRKTKLNVGIF